MFDVNFLCPSCDNDVDLKLPMLKRDKFLYECVCHRLFVLKTVVTAKICGYKEIDAKVFK